MKKILPAILLIAVLGGAGLWYWTLTPQYALKQISSAIKEHNIEVFHNYCDSHELAANAVDDLMSDTVREAGGRGFIEKLLGAFVAKWLKPQVTESMSNSIDNYVRGQADQKKEEKPAGFISKVVAFIGPPSLAESLASLGLSKKNYRGTTPVRQEGNKAHLDLKFETSPEKIVLLEVEMQNRSESPIQANWKVTRFSNLGDVAKNLAGLDE